MRLSSSAFGDGMPIPVAHATRRAGGSNVSIPYEWTEVPEGTRSLALELVDVSPVARGWVHWIVVDIPPGERSLAHGASRDGLPKGSRQLRNTFGEVGYGGPQPPPGTGPHEYVATLWALDVPSLQVPEAVSREQFEEAARAHALATASWSGTFER